MKKLISLIVIMFTTIVCTAFAGDKVTIQLKWVTQAQFAGYYVAKDKGLL